MRKLGLTKQQETALTSLALFGPGNIREVQRREGSSYASTHRSIKKLVELGLIWLSHIGERGPKSPQVYSITPLGILASSLLLDYDIFIDPVRNLWGRFLPKFLEYSKEFSDALPGVGFSELHYDVYRDTRSLISRIPVFDGRLLGIQRNSLDTHFLTRFNQHHTGDKMDDLMTVLSKDHHYREVWRRWFTLQAFNFKYLETLKEKWNITILT